MPRKAQSRRRNCCKSGLSDTACRDVDSARLWLPSQMAAMAAVKSLHLWSDPSIPLGHALTSASLSTAPDGACVICSAWDHKPGCLIAKTVARSTSSSNSDQGAIRLGVDRQIFEPRPQGHLLSVTSDFEMSLTPICRLFLATTTFSGPVMNPSQLYCIMRCRRTTHRRFLLHHERFNASTPLRRLTIVGGIPIIQCLVLSKEKDKKHEHRQRLRFEEEDRTSSGRCSKKFYIESIFFSVVRIPTGHQYGYWPFPESYQAQHSVPIFVCIRSDLGGFRRLFLKRFSAPIMLLSTKKQSNELKFELPLILLHVGRETAQAAQCAAAKQPHFFSMSKACVIKQRDLIYYNRRFASKIFCFLFLSARGTPGNVLVVVSFHNEILRACFGPACRCYQSGDVANDEVKDSSRPHLAVTFQRRSPVLEFLDHQCSGNVCASFIRSRGFRCVKAMPKSSSSFLIALTVNRRPANSVLSVAVKTQWAGKVRPLGTILPGIQRGKCAVMGEVSHPSPAFP
ncbi:uncharacterized protein MYCFIDRAFT_180406 [Pseudocercospora fijiensis CIRAD86]|uniref:Uncharacterized protein n=1 Tax=Pseudocercospora fijiensis (strain CIRAD86) TaxID=383855 RepID=M3AIP7_PSEFD|nr:uncharacterized protein MYCFIDRAFT_180406 [Pseudocercospora fijiensis CIRAD86]EME77073.1 hypothetical protein MYCFIDRAFT_180406 [Pseudocercospora fijiensis CIRAD86]